MQYTDTVMIAAERANARALGITLAVDPVQDRAEKASTLTAAETADVLVALARRRPFGCPTCSDGVRTVDYPVQCRACVREGGAK